MRLLTLKFTIILTCYLINLQGTYGRMNVLFLMADDLRPQLGCYQGSDFPSHIHPKMHTPNIDALAAKSLLFKRAYVQQALCSPSRTSLLTGRRPDTTHVYDLDTYFRNVGGDFTTLPEYFKKHGYTTIGMGKIYHPGQNASGGHDPPSWSIKQFNGIHHTFESKNQTWRAVPDSQLKNSPLVDEQIANRAIATIKDRSSKHQPFFLAVGFMKPHLPFVFPESMLQYYPKNNIHLPNNPSAPLHMPSAAWSTYHELLNYSDMTPLHSRGQINTTLPDQTTLDLRRAYYSAVTWTDSLVGRVIAEIENQGLANNTIISFLGDHGWQLGEHGEWCKHTNFELATHAPMMVHIPGKTDHGIRTEQLVEFVDLYPTLVEAAGLPSMPICSNDSTHTAVCREGTSLMPLIQHPHTAIKTAAFSQHPRKSHGKTLMGYTIRTSKYRYTEWPVFEYAPTYKPNWDHLWGIELYDHTIDPDENVNRAYNDSYKTIKSQLSQKLHGGWRNALAHSHSPAIVG